MLLKEKVKVKIELSDYGSKEPSKTYFGYISNTFGTTECRTDLEIGVGANGDFLGAQKTSVLDKDF